MCGDATAEADVAALVGTDAVQAVWTDPPYGIAYGAMRRRDRIAGDESLDRAEALTLAALALVPAKAYFVCCDWRSIATTSAAMTEAGQAPKACIVWDKTRGVQNLDRFAKQHEFVLYAGPFGGERTVDGDVWAIPRDYAPDHPTPKPVELIERCLSAATSIDAIVYDPFAGSGSTLIAADQLGRRCFAMEIDPGYCDVIRDRYAAWSADQ
jgi:DNA modification methylase